MTDTLYETAQQVLDAVDQLVLGKRKQATLILAAWIAGGHVLIDDVPGVAKTRLARSFAALTNLSMARVQGTPDLLPQDITGGPVYDMKSGDLTFRPGPVFHHILLVDEINRTTPRTQAALLECMEERQVTADGVTHVLPQPFLVMATQNPIEMEGTFPLPEAELDRFLVALSLGYPDLADERRLVEHFSVHDPISDLSPVLDGSRLLDMAAQATHVTLNPATLYYLVDLCRTTRDHPLVELGASPRTTLRFAALARAYVWLSGRGFVTPDDVKLLAPYVLGHRLVPSANASVARMSRSDLVTEIVQAVSVPVEETP